MKRWIVGACLILMCCGVVAIGEETPAPLPPAPTAPVVEEKKPLTPAERLANVERAMQENRITLEGRALYDELSRPIMTPDGVQAVKIMAFDLDTGSPIFKASQQR